jgi:hypothetical protein
MARDSRVSLAAVLNSGRWPRDARMDRSFLDRNI